MINFVKFFPIVFLLPLAVATGTWSAVALPIILILLLILINGFFVTSEFALLGARPSQMESLAEEGNTSAGKILSVLENSQKQNAYLATAQLGITIVTLGLAMYGEPKIEHLIETPLENLLGHQPNQALLQGIAYFIALALLTYLHVVLGEMIPKSIALADANKLILHVFKPMSLIQSFFKIPIKILNGIGNMLLRLFRIEPSESHSRLYSPEEIEQLVSESAEGGVFQEDEEEMIRNIFDFSEREVGHVMTPRRKVQAISTNINYDDLLTTVTESRHSRFPVFEDNLDHVIGILHLKDLIAHHITNGQPIPVSAILRDSEVPVVPEDQPIEDLLERFKRGRFHMAIVVDEFGGVAGIVTLEDLIEEVVGEVRDEFDIESEPFVEVEPGIFELTGNYLLDDLQEKIYLGEDLPEVDTIGGMIVTMLGRPAVVGDTGSLTDNVTYHILDVERRAIIRVRIEFPASDSLE